MSSLLWLVLWLGGLIFITYHRFSIITSSAILAGAVLLTTLFSPFSWFVLLILWIVFGCLILFLNHADYKRKYLFNPLFDLMTKSLPTLSETEKVALEAGTVGWDAALFSGQPQWEKLLTIPKPKLTEEEHNFIEGSVKALCEMVQDWEVTHDAYDLNRATWKFLKQEGFFALVIPKKYGGKGFSEFAHSEILTILASRSLTLASTVAVPNSLGPAELILRYGTPEQRDYYLPRLASGEEIPCFALTNPNAGSDATSIPDSGIVCRSEINGKETLCVRLNWDKRYITLAPIATLIGLAFKLYDPDFLLGDKEELGITCALIPVDTPGVTTGLRHFPLNIPFQNGPTQGEDVLIPLDWVIGGQSMIGQGWKMLVECLSTGRAISLPSSSVGTAKVAALATGAYSLIRRQFGISLCAFEGVQEVLARIGGLTYLIDAMRYFAVSLIDAGEKPAIPGAIAKYHVTELARKICNDAMDIHGGKGIMLGPKNYLGRTYEGIPIAITVEGANILTRSMIIFGQGAIRCHPYLVKEIQAIQHQNRQDFEHQLGEHIQFTLSNAARALFHGFTFSKFVPSPAENLAKPYFQQLARASSAFAVVSDTLMALLGGKLKFKESLSGRLGDLLSMMVMMSAVLKRYHDQGAPDTDLPLMRWSLDYCLAHFWKTMDALLRNLPHPFIAGTLRCIVMPLGIPTHFPSDRLNKEITQILTTTQEARNRLVGSVFISTENDSLAILEQAFQETLRQDSVLKRLHDATKSEQISRGTFKQTISAAHRAKIISDEEAADLERLDQLCQEVIAVDDFSNAELTRS